jgi:hypothetical protein
VRRAWGAALLLAAAAGCVSGPSDIDDELEENRRRWEDQEILDYEVVFRNVCFCTPDYTAPVRLRVRGGRIAAVTRESDGTAVSPDQWDRYRTVDQTFDEIEDAMRRGADQVTAEYHPVLGYPTDAFIDENEGLADEERGFQLSDLLPLR